MKTDYGSGGTPHDKELDIEKDKLDAYLVESRRRKEYNVCSDFPIITTLSVAAAIYGAILSFNKSRALIKIYNSLAFTLDGSYSSWKIYLKVVILACLLVYTAVWILEICVSWDGMRRRTCKCCCKAAASKASCTREATHRITFWVYTVVHFVYYILLLNLLFIVAVWMIAFVVTYCARQMCRGVTGSAQYYINLLSLANDKYDTYFQAMHFCEKKTEVVNATRWALYASIISLFANINLMGALISQRYRIHWGVDVLRSKYGQGTK